MAIRAAVRVNEMTETGVRLHPKGHLASDACQEWGLRWPQTEGETGLGKEPS